MIQPSSPSLSLPRQAFPLQPDGKRILSIDGGGMRGLFAIQVLKRIETILRDKFGPHTTLNSHYDLIAGTSSGAIIATCLRYGLPLSEIEDLYLKHGRDMFARRAIARVAKAFHTRGDVVAGGILDAIYNPERLSKRLREVFDAETLGSPKLGGQNGKFLLIVTVRSDTFSPWPLTNNPAAKYNDPSRDDSNLAIPLWQLVRASAAAPLYFPPQRIRLGKEQPYDVWFADGVIAGYNSPAAVAFRTATAPQYRMNWAKGTRKLSILSIGTSDPVSSRNRKKRTIFFELGKGAKALANTLDTIMINATMDQDIQCRLLGHTIYGHRLDGEMEDLSRPLSECDAFQYVRYQKVFTPDEISHCDALKIDLGIDCILPKSLSQLQEEGARYAEATVLPSHFPDSAPSGIVGLPPSPVLASLIMPRFRKKPVVVDAVQWTGSNGDEILRFAQDSPQGTPGQRTVQLHTPQPGQLTIPTLEGDHVAQTLDWIIRGVHGEIYPCKPDIFEKTYEPAS